VKNKTMSLSKKSLIGGLVGAVIAVGLIIGGSYAFAGSFFGFGGNNGGNGTLQISMTDPPNLPSNVNITHVYVNYTSIQVHVANAGNQSGWYNVTSSGEIDLMSVTNGYSQVLGFAKIPAGTYNIVRFTITSAVVTVHSSSGDKNFSATVPSGMVQATLTGVDVKPGQTSAILVDMSPRVTGDTTYGFTLVPSANAQPTTPK
jgi:hypothetical protein